MEKKKKQNHSYVQKEKYDYTKNSKIQDKQKEHEDFVNQQRNISGSYEKKEEQIPNRTREQKGIVNFEKNKTVHTREDVNYNTNIFTGYQKKSQKEPGNDVNIYNYTNTSWIQDEQKTYEVSVDRQRKIPDSYHRELNSDSFKQEGRKEVYDSSKYDYYKKPEQKEEYSNHYKNENQGVQAKYDYTQNSHIQDEQKTYEGLVNRQRKIPDPYHRELNSSHIKQEEHKETFDTIKHGYEEVHDSPKYGKFDNLERKPENNSNYRPNHYKNKDQGSQHSEKYDYTQNSMVQDEQKAYDQLVNEKRNIPNPYNRMENKPTDHGEQSKKTGTTKHRSTSHTGQNQASVEIQPVKTQNGDLLNPKATKYDYTKNVMVQGAQKEYLEKVDESRGVKDPRSSSYQPRYVSPINNRRDLDGKITNAPINLKELYKNSARGGEQNSAFTNQFGLSQEDIRNLLETRDIIYSRGVRYKASNYVSNGVGTIGHYLYHASSSGTDAGQGVRQMNEIVSPALFVVSDAVMMSAHKALQIGMADRLNKLAAVNRVFGDSIKFTFDSEFCDKTEVFASDPFIKNPEIGLSKRDIKELKQELLRKLKPSGLEKLDLCDPYVTHHQLTKFLKKNKGKLTRSEIGAVKMLMELTRPDVLGTSIAKRRNRFGSGMRMKLFRYAQQDSTGAGLVFIYTFYRRAWKTLLYGQRALRSVKNAVKMAGKLSLLAAKKGAVLAARTKLGNKVVNAEPVKVASEFVRNMKQKRDIIQNKKAAKKNIRNGRLDAIRERFRDPLGIRKNRDKLLSKFKKTKVGKAIDKVLSPYRLLKRMFAKVLTGIMTAVSTILSVVMVVIGVCAVVCIIAVLVVSIFAGIISMFDLSSSNEKVVRQNLAYIKELSEKQDKEIQNLNSTYDNVTVTYQDVKNQDAYNDKKHQTSRPVLETTNSAEMISMAQVYFNFNLEKQPKKEVKKYLRKLYNGSHLMTITTSNRTYTDDKGVEHTFVDANVLVKTYYFDELFNCKLMDGNSIGVIAGTEITDKVWNYLRTAGIPPIQVAGIMGNMYAESGFDPNLVEYGTGVGFGLCQWSYGRRTALENFAANQGKSPSDLQVQLDYFMTEYNPGNFNSYYTGMDNYSMFVNATSVNDATYYFMWGWERPSISAGESSIGVRQTAAQTYYDNYIDKELITDPDESEE